MSVPVLSVLLTPHAAGVCLLLHACLAVLLVELFFAYSNGMALRHVAASACAFVLSFAMLYVLEVGMLAQHDGLTLPSAVAMALALPLWAYAAAALVTLAYVVVEVVAVRRWQHSHVTPTAVKESLDHLPQALAFFDQDEAPLLVNLAMEGLYGELAGRELRRAGELWCAFKASSDNPENDHELLVRLDNEQVWMARRSFVVAGDKTYLQVSAANITDVHVLTNELRRQNVRLRERQEVLQEYGSTVREVARAKEVLDAKATVHDEMGHLLLATQHFMTEPASYDADRLLELWERVIDGLLAGVASQGVEGANAIRELAEVAATMGIAVVVEGEAPADVGTYALMARAVRECMLNVGKHAHGSELRVRFSHEGRVAEFTNNGEVPTGPIRETGGLRTLRQRVEATGGTMRVQSSPTFKLVLSFR